MNPTDTAGRRGDAFVTACVCAALLAAMFVIGCLAVRTKSPTMDEPLHAPGAFLHVFHRDYRINPEDPPLWNYWAMLPHSRESLRLDFGDEDWLRSMENTDYQLRFCSRMLFQTPGNDGVAFIQRTRTMMLLVAVLMLGPLLAWWSWKLGGAVAAVAATALLALDPNFIAHAPLVKNDVSMTFIMLALAAATWAVGRRLTWWNALLPGVVCGVGLGVKFSAVLLFPMLLAMLAARALLPMTWTCLGREVCTRLGRILVATSLAIVAAIASGIIVWASYGFHFDATPVPGSRLPMQTEVYRVASWQYFLEHGETFPTDEQLADIPPGRVVRIVLWAESHRLLPQPWLYGFLFTYRSTLARGTFLMGGYSDIGWWYYFPLAMLFKTPLATLVAFAFAMIVAIRWRRGAAAAVGNSNNRWTALCLTIPISIYGLSAMTSNLNLGLRHVLPLYPFFFLMTGLALARIAQVSRRYFRASVVILALMLASETLVNYPDYIPFFNAVFRPHRLKLLSDSNLDWSQDLPALAAWRQRNPVDPFYFCYFGTTDPAAYGIHYINLPGGFWLNPTYQWPDTRGPGVLAISATFLQGVNVPPSLRAYYAPLRSIKPLAVIGGSIYLYQLPLPPGVELSVSPRQ